MITPNMNWYVLSVKKGKENSVATALCKSNFEVYCPMKTEIRQWSDRKKKVASALFPSYVFVKLEDKDRSQVFTVPHVFKYLFWLGKPAIVRDIEIEAIDKWQKGLYDVNTIAKKGDKITLENGPFKGQDAMIEEISNKRVKLLLLKLGIHLATGFENVMAS
ncbi:MAG: UpxY family transcription antiterminator [Leeuwenhoekiella sp.]